MNSRAAALLAAQPAVPHCPVHPRLFAASARAAAVALLKHAQCAMAAEKAQPSGLAAEPHPALYFRPVSDRDVTVELEVVADAPPPAAAAAGRRTRGAKRQRGTAAAAAAPQTIAFQAASQLLKSASPKFW